LLYSAPDERAAGIIEESAARMSVTPIQIPEQTSDLETLRTLRLRHWRSLDRSGAREVYVLSHAEGEQRRWAALTDARSGALVAAGWAETPSAGGDPTVYRCSRDLDEEVSTALSFYDCLLDAIPFGGTVSGDAAGGIVSLEPHEHQPARAGWIIEIYRQSTSRGRRAVARAIVAPERRSARLCVPPGSSAPPAVFRGDFYRGFALSEGFSCY
jgi:hypothetical protein